MDKVTVFTDHRCPGCQDLKKTIKELNLQDIEILEINEHKNEAKKFNVFAVPAAVINGEKYDIFREGNCLIFKNKKNTVKLCKKHRHLG